MVGGPRRGTARRYQHDEGERPAGAAVVRRSPTCTLAGVAEQLSERLPRHVAPQRYDLTLQPDLGEATFTGRVEIAVEVLESVDEIVLNAAELEVGEAWVERADGTCFDAGIRLDEDAERLALTLDSRLEPGDWTVHLRFAGVLNDRLCGFYRSTFTDDDGDEHTIATTQFEATDARRAFPCWDEPDFKAVFAVTLVVPEDLTALSNARIVGEEPAGDGLRAVRFADTIRMSTYLVAFVVGPLEVTDPVDVDGVALRVAHPPGKGHLTGYALDVGAFALRYFADYFDLPYPGDKLDLVAIPDFAFGAMENLGCVTFREVLVLVDPARVTSQELQHVADVIAHELAHMWFGDLVTMRWWNGIWLNEAYATFMEMLATDAYRPDWDRWVSFGLSRSAAFDVDSLASTRPIEYPVESPADAEGMFDILTYEKGAAVVRMLEQYLGEETFRQGIRHYIGVHQYGNTETTDLWDALEQTSGQPTRRIMDSWIFQGGYPLVEVALDGTTLSLRQQRFRYLDDGAAGSGRAEPADPADEDGVRWVVPAIVRYETGDAATVERVLLDDETTTVDLAAGTGWVLVNAGGHGFFRVRYTPDLLDALTDGAQANLEPIERYALVDDAWASVLAGALTTPELLALVGRFGDESDLSVWQRLVGTLGSLDRLVDDEPREQLRAVVRDLVGPALDRMGREPRDGESDRDRELRGALFAALGGLGDDGDAQAEARRLHDRSLADRSSVDPSLAAAAAAVVAQTGDGADFDTFLRRSEDAADPQEEQRYLHALADFPAEAEMARLLDLTLTERVRSQNGPYVLRRALANRDRGAQAWAFVGSHWDELCERFPSNSIARMLEGVRSLATPALAAEVSAFLADHPVPQGAKIIDQHLERQRVNVALASREAEALAAHLT